MCFGIEVGLVDHGPPDDIARVDRLDLGSNDSPDRGAEAVGADEDVTRHRPSAVEMHGDAVRGLVETDEVAVEVIGTFRLDPAREDLQAVPASYQLGVMA